MEKRCGTCKTAKPVAEFGKNGSKADGLQSACRQCRRSVNAAYYQRTAERFNPIRQERRRAAIDEARRHLWGYLALHPCVDCGETDIVVLQFDHQGDKFIAVGMMVCRGYSWARILAEIAKCEVVCANDHARRTARSFGWGKATLASSEAEHPALNRGVGMSEFPRGTVAV